MSSKKRVTRALCACLFLVAGLAVPTAQAGIESPPWLEGYVFAGIGSGCYNVYTQEGIFVDQVCDGLGGFTTGCAFDADGDLWTTNFSANTVVEYDVQIPHDILQSFATPGVTGGVDSANESVLFDAAGNVFVGHPDGGMDIHKYDQSGNLLAEYDVTVTGRGSDWMDLAADQCTMYYTSENRFIQRYDVCTDTQLSNFATLPGSGNAFALRLLPPFDGSGGLIVADSNDIKRLDGSGNVVQTYDVSGVSGWFAFNLDPDMTSFWAGSFNNNNFYKFDIAEGNVLVGPIASGGQLFGLCVLGEVTAATFTCEIEFDMDGGEASLLGGGPTSVTGSVSDMDGGQGIVSLGLAPGSFNLSLDADFTPGDEVVFFEVSLVNPSFFGVGTVEATDGEGQTCSESVQLGNFDPFGGLDFTPTLDIDIEIDLPDPSIDGVRCVETLDPTMPDFGDTPYEPFTGDMADFEITLSEGDGEKIICCEFIDMEGNVSPPICDSIELIEADLTITCPDDVTVECGDATDPSATGEPTTEPMDDVDVSFDDSFDMACGNAGSILRTWTATDAAGASVSCVQRIDIVDSTAPTGGITSPMEGACFGPDSVPVTVMDDFADSCNDVIDRTYDPAPGPDYSEHGDVTVTVGARDVCDNMSSDSVSFTIDLIPPTVVIGNVEQMISEGMTIGDFFMADDDDGATGGIVHERIVAGTECVLLDGDQFGDGDGLLSDEPITFTIKDLRAIAEQCAEDGQIGQKNKNKRIFIRLDATDCGGNVGTNGFVFGPRGGNGAEGSEIEADADQNDSDGPTTFGWR